MLGPNLQNMEVDKYEDQSEMFQNKTSYITFVFRHDSDFQKAK